MDFLPNSTSEIWTDDDYHAILKCEDVIDIILWHVWYPDHIFHDHIRCRTELPGMKS